MRTTLDLCFCLLTLCGVTSVLNGVKVFVEEGSDAVLPCRISTEDLTGQSFRWKKVNQKEKKDVCVYDNGFRCNNGFKGRVSHFQNQLKNGSASIKINNTKMADSGNYSCDFPDLQSQPYIIELVVEPVLRDRSGEVRGAAPKPYITTLDATNDWALLQCEVQGASPKPKVEWKDSSGNILPAEEPQVSESGGRYDVTINITVTKTGRYRCEVTQEENSQQTYSETVVQLNVDLSKQVELFAAILFAVVVGVLCIRYHQRTKHLCNQIMKSCERLWKKLFPKSSYSPQNIHPPDDTEQSHKSPLNNGGDGDPGDENEPGPEPLRGSTASLET